MTTTIVARAEDIEITVTNGGGTCVTTTTTANGDSVVSTMSMGAVFQMRSPTLVSLTSSPVLMSRSTYDHLIFVIHGIGKHNEEYFSKVNKINHKFDKRFSGQSNLRTKFIAIEWHNDLHKKVGDQISNVKPNGLHGIRSILDDTFMDYVMWNSPLYAQFIYDTVVAKMNDAYHSFVESNPYFYGKVSVLAHSLGKTSTGGNVTFWRRLKDPNNERGKDTVMSHIKFGELAFPVHNFYTMGSPIPVLLSLRGYPAGYGSIVSASLSIMGAIGTILMIKIQNRRSKSSGRDSVSSTPSSTPPISPPVSPHSSYNYSRLPPSMMNQTVELGAIASPRSNVLNPQSNSGKVSKLVMYLSVADLLASIFVLVSRVVFIKFNQHFMMSSPASHDISFCTLTSGLVGFSFLSSFFWTTIISYHIYRIFTSVEKKRLGVVLQWMDQLEEAAEYYISALKLDAQHKELRGRLLLVSNVLSSRTRSQGAQPRDDKLEKYMIGRMFQYLHQGSIHLLLMEDVQGWEEVQELAIQFIPYPSNLSMVRLYNVRHRCADFQKIESGLRDAPDIPVSIMHLVKFVDDPLKFGRELSTDKEFIGTCIQKSLNCVPFIGPILAQTFAIFWPKDPNAVVITRELLEARLEKFKEEILKLVDEKIDKSMADAWKMICTNFFDSIQFQYIELTDKIIILKKMIREGHDVSQLQTQIRVSFDAICQQANIIINFCNDEKHFPNLIQTYMEALMIQNSINIMQCTYWLQFGVNPYVVSGVLESDENPAVKSLSEKYHDKSVKYLRLAVKTVNDFLIDNRDSTKFDVFLANVYRVLDTDMHLYPVPYVQGSVDVPVLMEKKDDPIPPIPTHAITVNSGATIYRFDPVNLQPDLELEKKYFYRWISDAPDHMTKCRGYGVDKNRRGGNIKFSLSASKKVMFRVCGLYSQDVSGLVLTVNGEKHEMPHVQNEYALLWPKNADKGIVLGFYDLQTTSGFSMSKQYDAASEFDFSIEIAVKEGGTSRAVAYFHMIELIMID
eukprot:gene14876-17593_t